MVALVVACTPATQQSDIRPLAEGETRIEGVVNQVEDQGYPRFTFAVQPESGNPVGLYLNAESHADLGGKEPSSFAGQPVIAYYTTADDPLVVDVVNASGAAVFGENIPASAEDLTVTGALIGAEATTSSDLPDVITVTDAAGAAHTFEMYIMPELAGANGQQVTVRYRPNERREITLLRVVGAD
ncbi:hypothetical protein U91I_00542 [alpha proteobacterium U9-1i]|nr:hypothetical protein U91I_00542 [alpha proteobacterium U9-1i]